MTRPPPPRYDPGLQPERTVLAWRRTLLAIAVAAAIGARLGVEVLGGAALVVGGVVLIAVLIASVVAQRRYRSVTVRLVEEGMLVGAGVQVAITGAGVVLLGVAALVALVVHPLR